MKNKLHRYILDVSIVLFLLLMITVILLPTAPFEPTQNRDRGVFLYIGEGILNGDIPYLDIWDHKSPLIYYIDALGLFIAQGSVWGVWVLELIFLCLSAILGYILLLRNFGRIPAIFGSVSWIISLVFVLQGGNLTEEFAILLQFCALFLFVDAIKFKWHIWHGYLIGVTCAFCFLLKPNLVGVQVAIVFYLIVEAIRTRQYTNLLKNSLFIFSGFISVIVLFLAYFKINNALLNLYDQVVLYNIAYSGLPLKDHLLAVSNGIITFQNGVVFIALTAWVLAAFSIGIKSKEKCPILILILCWLPIEFLLVSLSGRTYSQYYMAWLPALSLSTAYFAYLLLKWEQPDLIFSGSLGRYFSRTPVLILVLLIIIAAPAIPSLTSNYKNTYSSPKSFNTENSTLNQAIDFVTSHSQNNSTLLIWGAETEINFYAHRRSPTRFVYQYPLLFSNYISTRPDLISIFGTDLTVNPPLLIVDTSSTNKIIPPLDLGSRSEWQSSDPNYSLSPTLNQTITDAINAHYHPIGTIGTDKWVIYKRNFELLEVA